MARIITSESDVPAGYVPLSSIGNRTEQKTLSDAHNDGHLDAVKLMRTHRDWKTGKVWVDPINAAAILQRCKEKRDGKQAAADDDFRAAVPADARTVASAEASDAAQTLRRIEAAILRMADALEAMATRPS